MLIDQVNLMMRKPRGEVVAYKVSCRTRISWTRVFEGQLLEHSLFCLDCKCSVVQHGVEAVARAIRDLEALMPALPVQKRIMEGDGQMWQSFRERLLYWETQLNRI